MQNAGSDSVEGVLFSLKERAKELNCLYTVEELFSRSEISMQEILQGIAQAIPNGWQYNDVCEARITLGETTAQTPGFAETPAVRDGRLHEIKSAIILQPGPAALTDGLDALEKIIRECAE